MTEAYDGRQVVGIDLHRRRSVLVRMTEDGRKLETVRITNSPAALRAVIARAGEHPRVVIEATYGWYWAVDVLEEAGAEVHLAHPLGVKAYSYRRVKDDLLTELRAGLGQVSGQAGIWRASVCRRDHWRRRTAGVVGSGGAAVRFA
jgi:transposase